MRKTKPKIFIGSSGGALPAAKAFAKAASSFSTPTVWNRGVFFAGDYPLRALEKAIAAHDIGLFVFARDDVARMRGKSTVITRDNVLFEFGMSVGRLGTHRSFFLVPAGSPRIHIPSDLAGVTWIPYEERQGSAAIAKAMVAAAARLRESLKHLDAEIAGVGGKWRHEFQIGLTTVRCDAEVLQIGSAVRASYDAVVNGVGRRYVLEGIVEGHFITGMWRDTEKGPTYFGAFQLQLHPGMREMNGLWMGWSSRKQKIQQGLWAWRR